MMLLLQQKQKVKTLNEWRKRINTVEKENEKGQRIGGKSKTTIQAHSNPVFTHGL